MADEKDRARPRNEAVANPHLLGPGRCEERFGAEPKDELSPEIIFDRRWALSVLEQVAARLRNEYDAAGQAQLFEQLKSYIEGAQMRRLRRNGHPVESE